METENSTRRNFLLQIGGAAGAAWSLPAVALFVEQLSVPQNRKMSPPTKLPRSRKFRIFAL